MTSCLRMEIKILLFLPERSFATATNSFDFVSFLFSPFAINLHSRIGVLWSVRQLLFGLELELVSKELNHFSEIGHRGHWQVTVAHKQRFMGHLSVSTMSNLEKTTRTPPKWFNSLDTNSTLSCSLISPTCLSMLFLCSTLASFIEFALATCFSIQTNIASQLSHHSWSVELIFPMSSWKK